MKLRTKTLLLASLVILTLFSACKNTPKEELSLDPGLRKGVLNNGITYYIRHNEEPKERASFFIIQNVGALLENDDQNGLAHFLEHMSFNGTENFPGKGIINTLQHNGVEFGRNLNAYTSFDETVYNISEVPTTTDGLMDTCLLVLHDWCNYLLLTEEEIDAERGVITEEWRTRRTARSRMWNKRVNLLMKDSKYTKRDVIGSLDVIKHHKYETLRNFYHDWYRTDLQAIAIVGDFDVDSMEMKVKELFSPIPAVENAKERTYTEIPFNEEPIFGVVSDKEATSTSVNITFKHQQTPKADKDLNYYRTGIIRSLYGQMFNQRIDEIMQKENPPFLSAYSAYMEYVNNLDLYYIQANCKKNEESKALTGIMTENERVKRFGFTSGELERAKMDYLSNIESAFKQRDKISNDSYAREYARNYIDNEPIPGIEKELDFVKEFLPTITLAEINTLADEWISYKHMVIIASGPEGEDITHLTEEEAFNIIDSVRNSELKPYEDKVSSSSLIKDKPKGSKIMNTKGLPTLNAEEWTLKNGIRVVYRYSDIEKDRVYINAISKGGTSLYNIEDLPSANVADITAEFGLADYDPTTLQKMLAGKKAKITPKINSLSEGISGYSTPKDIETMFQLLYLTFEQPRFDATIFDSKMQQFQTYLENKKNDPGSIIRDKTSLLLTGNNPRTLIFNEAFLNQISLKKIEKIYRERFADADDFIFFITGNISKKELIPLVETYIGGLQKLKGSEDWIDHHVEMPDGQKIVEEKVAMETPKSTVIIKYTDAPLAYTPENILYSTLLSDILTLRYTEKVREEEGGTYGVSVSCYMTQYPTNIATLSAQFNCDPEKAKELTPIIYQELERIAKEGPTQIDLDKVITISKKNRSTSFEKNKFWIKAMKAYYWQNMDIVSKNYYENIIDKMTASDIQEFAQKLLKQSDMMEIVFYPEDK